MPDTAAGIEIDAVNKRYGDVRAVDNVTLSVPPGALVSLLGPSGSGKTTLLRLVGGFEAPDGGTIAIAGRDVTTLAPQKRPTATVFQSYALFPSMTVAENVGYGVDAKTVGREERQRRIQTSLDRVEMGSLGGRPVAALSGGQQQRVALARALAVQPEVLLFDEPLSNLDAALRVKTRTEIRSLQQELGITALYVTHDQEEALALSDIIAVLRGGRLVASGTPEALYAEPPTAYVARFLGGANIVRGPLAEVMNGAPLAPGTALAVRPEDLAPADSGVEATLVSRQFLGREAEWDVTAMGTPLALRLSPTLVPPEALFLRATRATVVRDDLAENSTPDAE